MARLERAGGLPAPAGNRHLAMSHGLHYCIGAALARAEASIVITKPLDAFPQMALAPGQEEPRWQTAGIMRSLTSLTVHVPADRWSGSPLRQGAGAPGGRANTSTGVPVARGWGYRPRQPATDKSARAGAPTEAAPITSCRTAGEG